MKASSHSSRLAAILMCVAFAISGCDNRTPVNANTPERDLDGYGNIKLGSSFEENIANLGADRFNSYSVSKCIKDLPIKGCYLSPKSDETVFTIKDGIPYTLSLSFNRWGRLTDIGLGYGREGDISQDQCRTIHERTIDWASREYGMLKFVNKPSDGTMLAKDNVTPAGIRYRLYVDSAGNFVTAPIRTITELPTNMANMPITKWDDKRYVSIVSSYIIVDKNPICNVSIDFSEPHSIERRDFKS